MADDGDRHDIKAASTQRRERDGHAAKQLSDHLVLDPGHRAASGCRLNIARASSRSTLEFEKPPHRRNGYVSNTKQAKSLCRHLCLVRLISLLAATPITFTFRP